MLSARKGFWALAAFAFYVKSSSDWHRYRSVGRQCARLGFGLDVGPEEGSAKSSRMWPA